MKATMRRHPAGIVVALLLAVFVGPLLAEAQQARRPYRVGVLHEAYVPNIPQVDGLKAGLKAMALEEGRDLTYDIRFSRGDPAALGPAAAELVRGGFDVLFAADEEATRVMKGATQTTPIVFVRVGDPVAAGLVASIARPGGNVTGVSSLTTELVPKRLELLKAIAPGLRRVWAVYHADDHSSVAAAGRAQEVAALLKLEVVAQAVRTREEMVGQLRGVRPGDGLLVPTAVALNIPGLMVNLERANRVPAVAHSAFWVRAGNVLGYGSDHHADGVQAARLVAKILRGARPQDIPVEGANRIELAVNLKTARHLGLTVPRDVLARADHVIE